MHKRCPDSSCFLTIDLPKNNNQSPLVMEQVLFAIHGAKIAVSFEVWAKRSIIQFALQCRRENKSFLWNLIENHYPGIIIRETKDFSRNLKKVYEASLDLNSPDIFPIRRYRETADEIQRKWGEQWGEILAPLRRVDNEETKAIQITIKPSLWQKKANHTLDIYKKTKHWEIFHFFPNFQIFFAKKLYQSWFLRTSLYWVTHRKKQMNHQRYDKDHLFKAAKSKISQLSFQVSIRFLCTRREKVIMQKLYSGFSQFNSKKMNGFKLKKMRKASSKSLRNIRQRKLKNAMKLSTEELAGILAFPTKNLKIPELSYVSFKIFPPAACKNPKWSGDRKKTEPKKLCFQMKI